MIYRRPVITPLDVELTAITASIHDPENDQSRYEGRLADGRSIILTSEWGDTQIEIERGDGTSEHSHQAPGPNFGFFSLEQLCDLHGIRLAPGLCDGEEIWRDSFLDWSGEYGYFWKEVCFPPEAASGFLDKVKAACPRLEIVTPYDPQTLPPGWLGITHSQDIMAFDGATRSKLARDDIEVWSNFQGGSLFAKFREGTPDQDVIEALGRIADKEFSNRIETVDLATNAVLGRQEGRIWYGRTQMDWCRSSPKRFVRVQDHRWGGGALAGTRVLR